MPSDATIELERKGCSNVCADYKLTLSADGTVRLEGKHVKDGPVSSTMPPQNVQVIWTRLVKEKFFEMEDRYGDDENAEPRARLVVRAKGKSKVVEHAPAKAGVGPAPLTLIEQSIEKVANVERSLVPRTERLPKRRR